MFMKTFIFETKVTFYCGQKEANRKLFSRVSLNRNFYATEAILSHFSDSDTFSQYPCIKACLEGRMIHNLFMYPRLYAPGSLLTTVKFCPFSET